MVNINTFDALRQVSHFFFVQQVDNWNNWGRKIGLDKQILGLKSAKNKKI